MNILVLYSTVEGHTRKIAHHVEEVVEKLGHDASVADVVQPGSFGLGSFGAAILCAPIHMGDYPAPFVNFLRDWADPLQDIPTALITVSLAIASKDKSERDEAKAFARQLEQKIGFRADYEHYAAGALKYLEYDFLRRWAMKNIAQKEGGPTDTSRDHELTDWQALDEFVEGFVKSTGS